MWRKSLDGKFGEPYCLFAASGQSLFLGLQQGQDYEEQTGTIVAIDASSGDELWRFKLADGRVCRILALAKNTVFICSQDTRTIATADNALIALDGATGEIRWTFPAGAHSLSPPAIFEDTLFFTTNDHRAYALDIQKGTMKWQIEELPPWSSEPPATGDGRFFIGSRAPILMEIDADDGSTAAIYEGQAVFNSKPAYQQNTLFAYGWDRTLYAVDVPTRKLRWCTPVARGASSPPVVGPYLYLGVKDGQASKPTYGLYAFDLNSGEVAWQTQTSRHVQAPPLIRGDALIAGDRHGEVYVLDALSGDLRWTFEVSAAVASQPLAIRDTLFLGTRQGDLLAIALPKAETPDLSTADSYREQRKWELAGSIAALNGDFGLAAADYEHLGDPYRVAQLREQAEMWPSAAASYLAAGLPAKALAIYRQTGDRKGEADTLVASNEFYEAATIYSAIGHFGEAARAFELANELDRAAAAFVQAGDQGKAADLYLTLGQPEEAAQLFLEIGDVEAAIEIYRKAHLEIKGAEALLAHDRAAEAAALFQEGGELRKAATLLEGLGDIDSAVKLYRQLGDVTALGRVGNWPAAAEHYLAKQPPMILEAARCYERAKEWRNAAPLYAKHGYLKKAALCWLSAGEIEQSRLLLEKLEPSESVARLLERAGSAAAAAETWVKLGKVDEAVKLLKRAGQNQKALELLAGHQSWFQLRTLAIELDDYEREAQACLELARDEAWDVRINLYNCAARALVKAAEKHEKEKSIPEVTIADLFEKASDYFDRALETEKAAIYRHETRRLRKWPVIDLNYQPEGSLVAEEWCELNIQVTNQGFGPARFITIRVVSDLFSGDSEFTQQLKGLLPTKSQPILLRIRPKRKAIGEAVPLDFELSYLLPDGQKFVRKIRGKVKVLESDMAEFPAFEALARERDEPFISIDPDTAHLLLSLQKQIVRHFSRSELRDLCFQLQMRFDFLEGDTLPDKVWSLVEYCQRHDRLLELRRKCLELRPNIDF